MKEDVRVHPTVKIRHEQTREKQPSTDMHLCSQWDTTFDPFHFELSTPLQLMSSPFLIFLKTRVFEGDFLFCFHTLQAH